MSTNMAFQSSPDDALGRRLREDFAGPDQTAYLGRLRRYLLALPERDTEWEVLATWARPGVIAVAVAATILLAVALLGTWRQHRSPLPEQVAAMPVAALMAPTGGDPTVITLSVLEGR